MLSHKEVLNNIAESKKSKDFFNRVLQKSDPNNYIILKIAYFITSYSISFSTLAKLCDLIFREVFKRMNIPIKNNTTYENDKMLKHFIESINYIIEYNVIVKAIKSPFYSLLFDESMDSSKIEQLIIYIRFFDEEEKTFRVSFLRIVELENQEGATICIKINKTLIDAGFDYRKCVSI